MPRNIYKTLLLGGLGAGVLAGIVGFGLAFGGFISVSARPPHLPATMTVLHGVFKASVNRAGDSAPEAPDLTDPGLIHLGAQHYAQVCSSCHGGPELGQSPVSLSMRPRPQHLAAVVDQFEDGALYEILRNGVRMSAMPSWPADSNFNEIWSVVAFLRQLPEMSHEDYVAMTTLDPTLPTSVSADAFAWDERGAQEEFTRLNMTPPMEEYLYASPSTGWRPIGLGNAPVQYCAACHGADGTGAVSGGHAPNLTIHSSEFIAQRLRNYASGEQASGIMATVASSLSEPQIDALADYYAALPPAPIYDGATAAIDEVGEQIVLHGLPDEAIPSCASCHGSDALAARPEMPALAGQSEAFLQSRLNSFRAASGTLGTNWNPMHAFALRLEDDEIDAVASVLAGWPATAPLLPAALQSDVALAQESVTAVCSTCHEANLNGAAAARIPNLTLQSPEYIKWQLELFRTGQRENSQMRQTVLRMDDAEIDALADYIGNLPAVATTPTPDWDTVSADALAAAQDIVANGDDARGIPSCASCHVAAADGIKIIPRLTGQQPAYLFERLQQFGSADATTDIGNSPMRMISSRLTVDERRALADYFSRQDLPVKSN